MWREGLYRGNQVEMGSLRWVLNQYDWDLSKREMWAHRDTHEEDALRN